MPAKNGTGNGFPGGQCTWWADERYHQLTGYYVPWNGNANQWATNSAPFGWGVKNTPSIGSIIVLQAGVQGASAQFGHVGVVEKINKDGSVVASNLNWGANPDKVAYVTFWPGMGVSFVSAIPTSSRPGATTAGFNPGAVPTPPNSLGGTGAGATTPGSTNAAAAAPRPFGFGETWLTGFTEFLGPNADVTQFLSALDHVMLVLNPFTIDNFAAGTEGPPIPIDIVNPFGWIAWLEQVSMNFYDDAIAMILRLVFIIVGAGIIVRAINGFIDFQQLGQNFASLAELGAMLA